MESLFYNEVKCNKCHKIVKRGIYKLKQHVARIGGDVKACVMQTDEDRKMLGNLYLGLKRRKWLRRGLRMNFEKRCAFQQKESPWIQNSSGKRGPM